MISVVTVPHTGTIYTLDLLRRWGVQVERKHLENTSAPPYGNERFGPGFPGPSSDEWQTYPDHRRVICTLRDPMLAVISAINRRVPDRDISVDGWSVMAEWWEVQHLVDVHFFPIPPTGDGLKALAKFAGAVCIGWMAPHAPTNTSEDRLGIKKAYIEGTIEIAHPTMQRAIEQLRDMPAVEELFAHHGFDSLPWFGGA